MTEERIPVFVYGSHLWFPRFNDTCRSAETTKARVASLSDWRVVFDKVSQKYGGSGKATLEASPGRVVWGVAYEVEPSDIPALEKEEGVAMSERCRARNFRDITPLSQLEGRRGSTYLPARLTVLPREGPSFEAMAYVAPSSARSAGLLPFDWYTRMLVDGSRKWELPSNYVQELARTTSKADTAPGLESDRDRGVYWLRKDWTP